MDQLIYLLKGMAIVNRLLRDKGVADHEASVFIVDGLFTTITNANFDNRMLDEYLDRAVELKNILIGTAKKHGLEVPALPEVSYHPAKEEYGELSVVENGGTLNEEFFSVLYEKNDDIRGLKQLAIYGSLLYKSDAADE